ncbi:MAG: hypothetical protein HEQ23_10535 [Tepidisphaera sp.]
MNRLVMTAFLAAAMTWMLAGCGAGEFSRDEQARWDAGWRAVETANELARSGEDETAAQTMMELWSIAEHEPWGRGFISVNLEHVTQRLFKEWPPSASIELLSRMRERRDRLAGEMVHREMAAQPIQIWWIFNGYFADLRTRLVEIERMAMTEIGERNLRANAKVLGEVRDMAKAAGADALSERLKPGPGEQVSDALSDAATWVLSPLVWPFARFMAPK